MKMFTLTLSLSMDEGGRSHFFDSLLERSLIRPKPFAESHFWLGCDSSCLLD